MAGIKPYSVPLPTEHLNFSNCTIVSKCLPLAACRRLQDLAMWQYQLHRSGTLQCLPCVDYQASANHIYEYVIIYGLDFLKIHGGPVYWLMKGWAEKGLELSSIQDCPPALRAPVREGMIQNIPTKPTLSRVIRMSLNRSIKTISMMLASAQCHVIDLAICPMPSCNIEGLAFQ